MNYKLDGVSISSLGASPALSGQALALHGLFDLPKRIGKTEHNWGTSIEPFVDEKDIELDGRTLTLHVVVNNESLNNFIQACIACETLSIDFDVFDVVCRDEIQVRKIDSRYMVSVPFWQDEYEIGYLDINPSASGSFRLDNFDLRRDFGIYVSGSDSLFNKAKRIDIPTTLFYERTNYRGSRDISIMCSMLGNSFADVYESMKRFHSLLMAPGMRTLVTPNKTLEVYFKSGMTVRAIKSNILQFNITATRCDNNL